MTQLNIFEIQEQIPPQKIREEVREHREDTENLSYRQLALHDYLVEYATLYNSEPQHKRILDDLDELYNFSDELKKKPHAIFNNLTSRRALSKDLEALAFSQGTHYIFTGHGYTDEDWKIERRVHQLCIEGKRAFRKMAICQLKRAKQNQLSYDFDTNRIEKINTKIKKLDSEIFAEEVYIKELERKRKEMLNERTETEDGNSC